MAATSSRIGGLTCCFVLLVATTTAGATQYKVGGDNGWAVPDAKAESFNTWAEKTSFQIGDQLVFVYPKDKDSVLLVEPSDYNACNTSSYDKRFDDGSTSFTLDRSGAFFFISGDEASCQANEKLIVMVAAAAAGGTTAGSAPAPADQLGSSPSTPPSSPSNDGGAGAQAPPSTPNAPAAKNSTTAKGSPPAAGDDKNGGGAGSTVAGHLVASLLVGCIAYAATLAF